MTGSPPVVLTVAGSDNSAGAGIQADLKTISALGGYGLTAVTCVVAEVPGKVEIVHPVPMHVIEAQIRLSLEAFPVRAVKTGMLYSGEVILGVADVLSGMRDKKGAAPWLVVDPVMVATSGDALLQPDAVSAYREVLLPMADLVTPNVDEAAVLLGAQIRSHEELVEAGRALSQRYGAPFLMKGGHLDGEFAIDYLVSPAGEVEEFSAAFVRGIETHGTGCTYAAAIATGLAGGSPMVDAVRDAKNFLTLAVKQTLRWDSPCGVTMALNHSATNNGCANDATS